MVEFCYCAVGSGTSNCPCFVRHRRAYHLSSKCCRTNCSAHYCMIVSRWAHSRSCVYKYLVLLCVEQCDYWNFGYQYLVLCAPCELAHIMVHFRIAFCCHYCCYCHWLFTVIQMKVKLLVSSHLRQLIHQNYLLFRENYGRSVYF